MPFEEGKSGHPGGRRRNSFVTDALLIEIKARENEGDKRGLRRIAVTIVDLAEAGERWAAEYIRDTLDGKPVQALEHGGDPDNPIRTRIEQVIIDPKG